MRAVAGEETIIQYEKDIRSMVNEMNIIIKEIEKTLSFIRKKTNQKDLLEAFKLYGISMKWLQP